MCVKCWKWPLIMFFKKKLQNSDEEITIREVFRIKTQEYGETVVTIYFDILSNSPWRKMGYCDLRMGMNPELKYLGQVGYHIEEKFRGHHYAYKACVLLFEVAKQQGMESLLITCNPDNIPSRKTLEALGGTLLEIADVPKDHVCFQNGETQKCLFLYHL